MTDRSFPKDLENMDTPLSLKDKILSNSIIKFIITGGINTVHNALWLYLFDKVLHIQYSIAFTMAFIIAMIGSFFLNTYFTFRTKPTLKKFLEFPITVLPNYLISVLGQRLLVETLKWDSYYSGLLASLFAIPLTYLVTKFILTKNDVVAEASEINPMSKVIVDRQEPIDPPKKGSKVNEKFSLKEFLKTSPQTTKKVDEAAPYYNYGTISKDNPWLDKWDIVIFLIIIGFSLLDHRYILRSEFLFGVKSTDSTVQMIYFLPYLIKDFILGGQSWSWSYGMGGDVFSEFSYYYTTSPLIWIIAPFLKLFPESIWSLENSLNLKLFISIFKQSIFMIFMYILLRYEKRSKGASVAGAMIFGGGLYYLWNANYFDFMTDAYIWVPLMVLGMRIFQKTKNFWPLLISAALAVINNYYFGFHTFVFFIFFVVIMIVPHGNKPLQKLTSWLSQLLQYAVIGLGAVLLSAFVFIPAFKAFIKIDRFDLNYIPSTWHGMDFLKNLPINLFFNNSTIAVPMLIILIFFLNYRKTRSITDRKSILLILSLILYCSPMTGYFLNGMNYYSERWYYLFIFVLGYVTADYIDEMKIRNSFTPWSLLAIIVTTVVLITGNWEKVKGFKEKDLYVIILLGNLLAFTAIAARHTLLKVRSRKFADILVVIGVAIVMLGNSEAIGRDTKFDMNTKTIESEKMMSQDLKDIMSHVVPKENEFYRTVFRNNTYENAPTYFRYYGISTFSSMTDGNMHIWLKKVLGIRHNITYLSSFMNTDDRIYLEGLLGVRYIITDKATNYIPPPQYKLSKLSNKTYNLYENQNYVGLDMWFTETYPEDKVKEMPNMADKDVQLLNYAITPEQIEGIPEGKEINTEVIPLNDSTMILSNVDKTTEEQVIDNENIVNNYLNFKEGGFVTFKIPEPKENSQVYFHSYVRPDDREGFEQTINNKRIYKAEETNVYVYSINDWTWAFNGSENNLVWKTPKKKYQVENMMLSRVDLTNYDDVVKARNKYNMENLVVGKDRIEGTVNNKEKGIMVFNIPFNKGWSLKVNGKPVELKRMNGFLSGVVLEPGSNKLEFRFRPDGLTLGLIISFLTFLISVAAWYFMRRKGQLLLPNTQGEKMTLDHKELYTELSENYGIREVRDFITRDLKRRLKDTTYPSHRTSIKEDIDEEIVFSKENIDNTFLDESTDQTPKVIFKGDGHRNAPFVLRNRGSNKKRIL